MTDYVLRFNQVTINDVEVVGGKNASLGEMIGNLSAAGVSVPDGFATTADAYREFLAYEGLDERINNALADLNVDDIQALTSTGRQIREWIHEAPLPPKLEEHVRKEFEWLEDGHSGIAVAVRSSATAEDLPDASFAGQQETHLNIVGIENVLFAIRDVFASLFNDRAI
ncbi:MAG: PEP/pyruvate-binding domain-containing protein, partial [Pseudomonadota bacterium]|nr:PEP/pyruvate-binding domain-containing protein [Pseudomonadota bacterium]